jgi:hypothetical protein
MKQTGFNPYMPSWEYVPDGEPHVYGDRVYVYGSHDRFNGHAFCLNDYVCWSAPVNNLRDWRYEGVIYGRSDDPCNQDGKMCLYAPDVTRGSDGRYYLYYCLNGLSLVSVAVCDEPAGRYQFYGYVKHQDGTRLGEAEDDEFQFDPGVLTEGEKTYLYTGFCPSAYTDRTGARMVVLGQDMLTITEEAVTVVPSSARSAGTGYEGHEFFEASSMRRVDDKYYFIYSSVLSHELCYAIAEHPSGPFAYGGTIVSNGDIGIDSWKPAELNSYFINNNHGSIENINGQWYVFYHRPTNSTSFSRQGMLEPINIHEDGTIPQVEMTSCGPNAGPLEGFGEFPAYIACNLIMTQEPKINKLYGMSPFPKITQEKPDHVPEEPNDDSAYIANMTSGVIAGFKYFDCRDLKNVAVQVRGMSYSGKIIVTTTWDAREEDAVAVIPVAPSDEWHWDQSDINIANGINALYFRFEGYGSISLKSFILS